MFQYLLYYLQAKIIVKSSTVSIIVLRCNRIFLLKYSRTFLESCHLISKIICKMQLLRFILYPLATLVHTEVNFLYRLFFCRLITFCNLLVFRNLRDFQQINSFQKNHHFLLNKRNMVTIHQMVIFSKLGLFNLLFTIRFHQLKITFMKGKTKPEYSTCCQVNMKKLI